VNEQNALSKGMEQKAEEFVKQCGQLYLEKQANPTPMALTPHWRCWLRSVRS